MKTGGPYNRLVPQGKEANLDDPIQAEDNRARVRVVITAFVATGFSAIPMTFMLYMIALPESDLNLIILSGVQTLVLSVVGLAVYRFTRSVIYASQWYALTAYMGILIPGLITGGFWYSPYFHVLILVPAWTFLMLGRAAGLIWSSICLVTLMIIFVADLSGVSFVQVIPGDYLPMAKLIASVVGLILVVICMYWYDFSTEFLRDLLYTERNKLSYHAHHDDLTGLANRKLFRWRLSEAIDFALVEKIKAAVLYIDLDDFKPINDKYGHEVGDEVLVVVADRLKAIVRSSDTVARLGGDEFGIVLLGAKSNDTAFNIAEQLVSSLNKVIEVQNIVVQIGVSVGIVAIPDQGADVDRLLRAADVAMYQAKASEKHVCIVNLTAATD